MWEQFQQRLEAEHYLGPALRAKILVDRYCVTSSDTDTDLRPDEEDFRRAVERLTSADLQAVSLELARRAARSGPPPGQYGPPIDVRSFSDRVGDLRRIVEPILEGCGPRPGQVAAEDLASIEECRPIDDRIETAVRAAVAGTAGESDLVLLAEAVRDYGSIHERTILSPGGRRLVAFKLARALDGLGRGCLSQYRDVEAKTHFAAAARRYTQAGDTHLAAVCERKAEEAAQRQLADADVRLRSLLAQLETVPAGSLERAMVLVGLAELANANDDTFEAGRWLAQAQLELRDAGFRVPEEASDDGDLHATVSGWIDAIPAGDGQDPNAFLRQFSAVLTLQTRITVLHQTLGSNGVRASVVLDRLAEITSQLPEHTRRVTARLRAQLDDAHVGLPPDPLTSGDSRGSGHHLSSPDERQAIAQVVIALLAEASDAPPATPEQIVRWRGVADDAVRRARALGEPITLAQALEVRARVALIADEPTAAIELLEQSHAHVAGLGGTLAIDQALIALSELAKIHLGLRQFRKASQAAQRAIELIERDRYRVNAPFQQAALLAPHAEVFAIGVFAAWQLGDLDTMLQRMELSKARASVRRLFSEGGTTSPAGTGSDPRRQQARDLDRALRDLHDAIHRLDAQDGDAGEVTADQGSGPTAADPEQTRLRQRRRQLWDLRAIARREPDTAVPEVTVRGIQARLDPDEVIVYYYWLRPLTLLLVTMTADDIVVERMSLTAEDRSLLEDFSQLIGRMRGSNLGLDAAFIAPLAAVLTPAEGVALLEGKERLIVSPHRLLHGYPFPALPYQGRPLVRSFTVRHVPNLTSLLVPSMPGPRDRPRLVTVAVSQFRPPLDALPMAPREAAEVAGLYAAAGVPVQQLTEPTRTDVLEAMRAGAMTGAWCVHLATHGHNLTEEVSRDAPLETVLELAGNSCVDGYEIASAPLGCEVVVLATCDAGQLAMGGRGRTEQPGDELFGLPAALIEAGCRNVVAATWPVADRAAAELMTNLHRRLARGAPADIALAGAQRDYLDHHPDIKSRAYYWASLHVRTIGRPRCLPVAAAGASPSA